MNVAILLLVLLALCGCDGAPFPSAGGGLGSNLPPPVFAGA